MPRAAGRPFTVSNGRGMGLPAAGQHAVAARLFVLFFYYPPAICRRP